MIVEDCEVIDVFDGRWINWWVDKGNEDEKDDKDVNNGGNNGVLVNLISCHLCHMPFYYFIAWQQPIFAILNKVDANF